MKILSLNLTTSWTTSRKSRMQKIRQFIEANGVDVVLFQEGLQVCWPFYNSLRHLCPNGWWCYSKGYNGVPWWFSWRVGVLSRYEIVDMASLGCEVPQTAWLDSLPYPGRKRAVAVTVEVPDLGRTTLVSVHLTASPKTVADKTTQLKMVADWKAGLPARDVTIYGGDFNTSLDCLEGFGYGYTPDYIFVAGAKIVKGYPVLQGKVVTDHECGVVAEVEKA